MRKSAWISVFWLSLFLAAGAFAKTPDGKTPAEETICDNEEGAAYGLCVAYCEAMDCLDPNQHASDRGCQSVKNNFEKKTGRPLPCTLVCPCPGITDLAARIVSGDVVVNQCVMSEAQLFVETSAGSYTIGNEGVQPSCGSNGEPSENPLTSNEGLACRLTVRKAVEARGGVCVFPE